MKLHSHDVNGTKVFIRKDSPDETVANSCLGDEFSLLCQMLARIDCENTILDLGGYIGVAAIKFATTIPHCTVITLEPSPENFQILQLNTMQYRNIIAVNAAVGSACSKKPMYSRNTGEWGHTLVSTPKDCFDPSIIDTVDVLTIHQVLEKYSPPHSRLSLVKIDIEGGEVDLLSKPAWIEDFAVATAELHDRIIDGCTNSWIAATSKKSRFAIVETGEKMISVNPALLRALH